MLILRFSRLRGEQTDWRTTYEFRLLALANTDERFNVGYGRDTAIE